MPESSEKIATNLRKGVLEYCVLALLQDREMYGLEIANELMDRELSASEGSLYPLLARMKTSGSVDTRWEQAAGSRSRKYYAITAEGQQQLATFEAVWNQISAQVYGLLGGHHG
ncbi:PadR family transcriptional regulator [Glutamicibacter uratoxydans]|uniref:PadR family transcriptional regulator n=1 Tax=Glutamicibacter uratoxydans TaxID=43667 RepID=UPI003D6EF98A